ncbi:hypothetical protein IFM89_028648 [Coptis chinensis]|uniref:Uncharacterized protein n=1 Tax=Coptis chinensis TaxID=261450 RepID=A0A835GYD9_9MAGN|nr:hypothetical protein IFM89_028648 [Coptis chinensis]
METLPENSSPVPSSSAMWKNYRVVSGHHGAVRSVAFDPSNSWFCTGSADHHNKNMGCGTGVLKHTLTGHIGQVRALAVSPHHTYMFSAGDDKQVKCWDLEQNKVIRSYHGHLSGVHCLAIHPTIDVLLTGGRDSVCRVWDIRSKSQIHAISGHNETVCSVLTQGRALAQHPQERCFASASYGDIKKFKLPKGESGDNGTVVLGLEEGIPSNKRNQGHWIARLPYTLSHGSRLVTCEGDMTIKMWKQ